MLRYSQLTGFPGGTSGKEPTCQCRRHKGHGWSLGQEDPLEEGMASHSSILPWRIPWTEEPGMLQSMGLQRAGHGWATELKHIYASLVAQLIKNLYAMLETQFNSWIWKFPWRQDRLPTLVFLGFPGSSDVEEFISNVGDLGLVPGSGRSPGGGHGHPL